MSRSLRLSAYRTRSLWAVATCAIVALVGCDLGARRASDGQTQTDILRNHYPDLAGGRFAVIADFEEPSHAELFHTASGDMDGVTVADHMGIEVTGGTCLVARLQDSDSALIADNTSAESWLLKRDWRSYDLLMMNVFSPESGLNVDLSIASGDGTGAGEAHSLIPLREGWNLLRLDLDEASDFVALDDIRSVSWSIPGLTQQVEIKIDDIVLAENRSEVYGQSDGPEGSLYIYQQGRRLHVGAVKRFEIGFSGGQIVRWYDLGQDPLRLSDLVGAGSSLGPTPVVLPNDESVDSDEQNEWPAGFSTLGKLVRVKQSVVEANAVRAVVECVWAFQRDAAQGGDDAPIQSWRYVIYPSGHVFVTVEATVRAPGFAPSNVGLIVNRALANGMVFDAHEPGGLGDARELQHVAYAYSSLAGDSAGLLFVPHDSRQAPRMRVLRATEAGRASIIASGGRIEGQTARWGCMFRLWKAEDERGKNHVRDAVSYAVPPSAEFLVGSWDCDSPGDVGADGFDEGSGTYVLSPDGNRVQLKLDGESTPLVRPAFRVPDIGDRDAWVYVDYAIHKPVARNDAGDLVFQLPKTITEQTVVEVYLKRP